MAVGRTYGRSAGFFLSLWFLVLYSQLYTHTSVEKDFAFIKRPIEGFEYETWKFFKPSFLQPSVKSRNHRFPLTRHRNFNSSNGFIAGLLLLWGDIISQPGPIIPTRAQNGGLTHQEQHNPSKQQMEPRLLTLHANAWSIVNKTSRLELDIASSSYDIITLTETHLDDSISDGDILPSNYTVFRRDGKINSRSGGGVLIATRDYIKAVPHDTSQYNSEFIFVDLLLSDNHKVTLGVFYRPPNNDTKPLEDLQAALQMLSANELILLGDFNLPEIDWLNTRALRQSNVYTLFMDIVQDNVLTQLVKEPTRESNILDLVLTTSPDSITDLSIGEPFSDHNSINFSLSGKPYVQQKSQRLFYCYGKAD